MGNIHEMNEKNEKTKKLLDKMVKSCKNALCDNYVGLYIHGSLVMSGYNPNKSDIDFIIVCKENPKAEIKKEILDSCEALWKDAPAKGFEMHLLRLKDCLNPADEPKFVLHYSAIHRKNFKENPWNYIAYMQGEDMDLNAHITVLKARGICYDGIAIEEVFGKVSKKNYVKALLDDCEWNADEALYHVLNSARCLAYIREGKILSKKEGGIWAIEHLPAYKLLLEEALKCCDGEEQMIASEEAKGFCDLVTRELSDFYNTIIQTERGENTI